MSAYRKRIKLTVIKAIKYTFCDFSNQGSLLLSCYICNNLTAITLISSVIEGKKNFDFAQIATLHASCVCGSQN